MMPSEEAIIRSSGENVIELIKEHRDELIHRISQEQLLMEYLRQEFHIDGLSTVKLEFVRRSLLELASSPVDLSHYAALILDVRRSGTLSISNGTERFFKMDIEQTIKNYL